MKGAARTSSTGSARLRSASTPRRKTPGSGRCQSRSHRRQRHRRRAATAESETKAKAEAELHVCGHRRRLGHLQATPRRQARLLRERHAEGVARRRGSSTDPARFTSTAAALVPVERVTRPRRSEDALRAITRCSKRQVRRAAKKAAATEAVGWVGGGDGTRWPAWGGGLRGGGEGAEAKDRSRRLQAAAAKEAAARRRSCRGGEEAAAAAAAEGGGGGDRQVGWTRQGRQGSREGRRKASPQGAPRQHPAIRSAVAAQLAARAGLLIVDGRIRRACARAGEGVRGPARSLHRH